MAVLAANPPLLVEATAPVRAPRRPFRILRWLATVVLVGLAMRIFVGEAAVVPTASMEGTILVGDHILLSKLLHGPRIPWLDVRLPRLKSAGRGDIVAFRSPLDPRLTYLKRVIAVAGDRVEILNGVLYRNGDVVREPYVVHRAPGDWHRQFLAPQIIPQGHIFVMGDNRDYSKDSRDWGSIPEENVVGEPLLVFWSYEAPPESWLDRDPERRMRFYASIVGNFFSGTRWSRTGTLL